MSDERKHQESERDPRHADVSLAQLKCVVLQVWVSGCDALFSCVVLYIVKVSGQAKVCSCRDTLCFHLIIMHIFSSVIA